MKKITLLFAFCLSVAAFAQDKPNILIIHTDDLGYHDLSITGSQLYNTDNIDQLAKESVSFANAYSSYPRCTPSRYGMITGTYPVNEDKGWLGGVPEDKNFVKQFNNAGYNTSYVGKWHLGNGDSAPDKFGFSHIYAAGEAGGIASRHYPFNIDAKGKKGKYYVPNVQEDGKEGDYASDLLTDATIKFIKNNPKNEPFLAVLAYYAVHTPIEAKPEDEARNKEQLKNIDFGNTPEYIKEGEGRRKMRQDDAAYAGMVENVDENVGRLLKALKELNIDKNTIIVFSSDHGGLSNDGNKNERHLATTNLPLKAGKGHLYEGGIRVPLFVKWTDKIAPKQDNSSIILGMDVFPTLLDLAIDKKVEGVDGKSYAKVLKGKEAWQDRTVFWISRKARPHSTGDSNAAVVRSGDYKLIQFLDTEKIELYNLKNDIGEGNNLATSNPKKAAELLKTLEQWKEEYLVPEKLNVQKMNPNRKKGKKKGKKEKNDKKGKNKGKNKKKKNKD
ncbi:sulfatase [Polaribacter haliotis]|uniref:Sulfatase n=1 Tax=Polaribacter haliotis TaxID=1888915 RepID=A0A7L8AJ31_9FLAO|nr:sulfatase [Polaribacter haliotis]QOD61977.1 sulfatase [Polaribacter haliotis]